MRFSLIAIALILACSTSIAGTINDPALDKHITLSIKGEALSDVLKEVKKQTGVSLSVSKDIADQKATIFVDDKPAREVLQGIATLFDYTWRTTTVGDKSFSELIQTPEAKERQVQRDSQYTARGRSIKSLASFVRKMTDYTDKSDDELNKLSKEYYAEWDKLRGLREPYSKTKLTKENIRQYELAEEAYFAVMEIYNDRTAAPVVKFYNTLPKNIVDSLMSGKQIFFDSASTEDEWRIPSSYASEIISALQQSDQRQAKLEERTPDPGLKKAKYINVRFYTEWAWNTVYLNALIECYPGDLSSKRCYVKHVSLGHSSFGQLKPDGEDTRENYLPKADRKALDDMKVTITFEDLLKERGLPDSTPAANANRGDVLAILHKKAGLQIIADYYSEWEGLDEMGAVPVSKLANNDFLVGVYFTDRVENGSISGWDGKYLYARSTAPVKEGKREISSSLLTELQQIIAKQGHFTLDQLANAAAILNPDQINGLTSGAEVLKLGDLHEWQLVDDAHKFYGLLTSSQRKKLAAGGLKSSELSELQMHKLKKCFDSGLHLERLPRLVGAYEDGLRVDKPGAPPMKDVVHPVFVSLKYMGLEDVDDIDPGPLPEAVWLSDGDPSTIGEKLIGYTRCEFYDLKATFSDGSVSHREIKVPIKKLGPDVKPLKIEKHVDFQTTDATTGK